MQADTQNQPTHVTLIMINYNGRRFLGDLLFQGLRSTLATRYPSFDVIFVDNDSDDDSPAEVEREFCTEIRSGKLRLIKFDKNYGYAGGAERALGHARGDIIGILNTDIVVEPDWLGHLVATLERRPRSLVACPKIMMLERPDLVASAGGAANILLVAWDRCLLAKDEMCTVDPKAFHPAGAAFVFKRELLRIDPRHQLFDPEYFAYFEDVALGWKVQVLGYETIVVPQARIFHKCGGTFGRISPEKFFLMRRNAIVTAIKYMESRLLLALMPLYLLSTLFAGMLFSQATGDRGYVFAAAKAVAIILMRFPHFWSRKLPESSRKVPTSQLTFSSEFPTYKPSSPLQNSAVRFLNKLLEWLGLPNARIESLRPYPTFEFFQLENDPT